MHGIYGAPRPKSNGSFRRDPLGRRIRPIRSVGLEIARWPAAQEDRGGITQRGNTATSRIEEDIERGSILMYIRKGSRRRESQTRSHRYMPGVDGDDFGRVRGGGGGGTFGWAVDICGIWKREWGGLIRETSGRLWANRDTCSYAPLR